MTSGLEQVPRYRSSLVLALDKYLVEDRARQKRIDELEREKGHSRRHQLPRLVRGLQGEPVRLRGEAAMIKFAGSIAFYELGNEKIIPLDQYTVVGLGFTPDDRRPFIKLQPPVVEDILIYGAVPESLEFPTAGEYIRELAKQQTAPPTLF